MDDRRLRKIGAIYQPRVLVSDHKRKSSEDTKQLKSIGYGGFRRATSKILKNPSAIDERSRRSQSVNSIFDIVRKPTRQNDVDDLEHTTSPGYITILNRDIDDGKDGDESGNNFHIHLVDQTPVETKSTQKLTNWQNQGNKSFEKSSNIVKDFKKVRSNPTYDEKCLDSTNMEDTQDLYIQMLNCIRLDDCKTLRSLLKRQSVDVNVVLEGSGSLLHEASHKGCCKCIKSLLKSGSYVSLCDEFGFMPLHAAVLGRSYNAVRLLLENSALPNQKNFDGLSPFHLSVMADDIHLVHELIMAEGDPLLGCPNFPFRWRLN